LTKKKADVNAGFYAYLLLKECRTLALTEEIQSGQTVAGICPR
jgi:hypothetical protein